MREATADRPAAGTDDSAARRLTTSHWLPQDDPLLIENTIGGLLREAAGRYPDRVALVEADPVSRRVRRWTYSDLHDSAERLAGALLAHFRPGECIAVWSSNSAEWLLLQHGAAMAGLVLVTVNPAYLGDEVSHVLGTAKAAGLFFASEYRGRDQREIVYGIRARLPLLRSIFIMDEILALRDAFDRTALLASAAPGDMVQIQFTSGTTGFPKGACLHHRGLLNTAHFAALRAGFPEGGVWLSAMPLFHIGGSTTSQFGAYTRFGTFVMLTQFDEAFMLETMEAEGAHHIHAVPTMVTRLIEHPSRPTRDLSSLKTIMSGGSPVPAALVVKVQREFGCRFTITFGQTELHGIVSQTFPDDLPECQVETIGTPSPAAELKIVDPESGDTCAIGEAGEIWVRGYQTMLGYFDLADASRATLAADGWLRTGDQATMDANGYLRIAGRLKDCIIRGGENIYPREIEDALWSHEAIAQAAVLGLPDEKWGEIVVAVLRVRDGTNRPTAQDLHEYCRSRLAAYKTPAKWIFVEEMPMTSSGKVQKFILKAEITAGGLVTETYERPRATETLLPVQSSKNGRRPPVTYPVT